MVTKLVAIFANRAVAKQLWLIVFFIVSQALREKEKGDWKKLTIEEKKTLYRASFCQTYSEMHAATGHWKIYISGLLIAFSSACWIYMVLRTYGLELKMFNLDYLYDLLCNSNFYFHVLMIITPL